MKCENVNHLLKYLADTVQSVFISSLSINEAKCNPDNVLDADKKKKKRVKQNSSPVNLL